MVLLKPWVGIRLLSKRTRDDKEVGRKLDLNFPGGAVDKNLPANAGDMGLISGPGRFHIHGEFSPCATTTEAPSPYSPYSTTIEATTTRSLHSTTRE